MFNLPNYTQVPNYLIDNWMHKLSHAEFKFIMLVVRYTCGYHRRQANISYKTFETKCGINIKTARTISKKFEDFGWIRVVHGDYQTANSYEIITAEHPENQDDNPGVSEQGGWGCETPRGRGVRPLGVGVSDPYLKERIEIKEERKESRNSVAPSEKAFGLSSLLLTKMKENNPRTRDPEIRKWAIEIERMNRIDKYSWDEIEQLIIYSQEDEFWQTNILSAAKLRKQAARLMLQQKKKKKGPAEDAHEKIQRMKQNKEAAELWKSSFAVPDHRMKIYSDYCEIKVYESWFKISYYEHGFEEQIRSAFKKADF